MHDSFGPAALPLSSSTMMVKAEFMRATLCEFATGVNAVGARGGLFDKALSAHFPANTGLRFSMKARRPSM